MLWMVLRVAHSALRIASLALLIYCVMSIVMPDSPLFRRAAYYMERVLSPIRWRLWKWFPALRRFPVDLSALVLWLLIDMGMAVVNVLGRVFY